MHKCTNLIPRGSWRNSVCAWFSWKLTFFLADCTGLRCQMTKNQFSRWSARVLFFLPREYFVIIFDFEGEWGRMKIIPSICSNPARSFCQQCLGGRSTGDGSYMRAYPLLDFIFQPYSRQFAFFPLERYEFRLAPRLYIYENCTAMRALSEVRVCGYFFILCNSSRVLGTSFQ